VSGLCFGSCVAKHGLWSKWVPWGRSQGPWTPQKCGCDPLAVAGAWQGAGLGLKGLSRGHASGRVLKARELGSGAGKGPSPTLGIASITPIPSFLVSHLHFLF
jgi:hypothetical protein